MHKIVQCSKFISLLCYFVISLIVWWQEVIEFPVLKVNAKTFTIESVFHHYVQPKVHRHLTPFCTEVSHCNHFESTILAISYVNIE